MFYPLVLAFGLFSVQPGVLPFAQNFLSFIWSFFVLGLAVVMTVIVLFNLDSLYHLYHLMELVLQKHMFKISRQKLKADEDCENRSAEVDVPTISSRTVKRGYHFRRRLKKLGLRKTRDPRDDIV